MTSLHQRLRHWTWIALLAVFGLVLAPTVSAALSASEPGVWVEVCSAQGSRVLVVDEQGVPAPSSTQAGVSDHCLLCGLGVVTLPLADRASEHWGAWLSDQPPMGHRVAQELPPAARAPAQPRAPPSGS